MIIYIYGSDSFKDEINDLLNHSNIKFRLDDNGEIIELNSLDDLKNAIEDNPKNIYLIDDSKIIKKNSLNQKINFLKPKDGIEQAYLLDHGIGDISVDSMDELSKHIIKRLETESLQNESEDIQSSIVEMVEDAYEKDEEDEENCVQLDDELSSLLSQREDDSDPILEEIDEISSFFDDDNEKKDEEIEDLADLAPLEKLNFEEDFDNMENNNEKFNQGDDMSDEFAEFNALNEDDILAALDGLDVKDVSTQASVTKAKPMSNQSSSNAQSIDLGGTSSDEIAKLISQLLNNKTLEITIKVKD